MSETKTRSVEGAKITKPRGNTALIVGAVIVIAIVIAAVALTRPTTQSAGFNWHPQQESQGNSGPADGSEATLTRSGSGISFEVSAASLQPGNAYTLWAVVVNNPEACEASPCTAPEILGNAATGSQVLYADGAVADSQGDASFDGSLDEGPLEGWLEGRTFDDASTAEIHLVINDHGPELAEFMPGMIETYRGGCSDESPFPGIFPSTALADGAVGPNTCLLAQSVIFGAP